MQKKNCAPIKLATTYSLEPLSQPEETDYEKILSNLDNEIKKVELRLSEIKLRERRVVLVWLFYSTLAYAVYLVGFFFFFSQGEGDWAIKVLPIPLTPVAYVGYIFI